MGMGIADFEQMTPSEFRAAWDAWLNRENRRDQGEWERARWIAMFILMPWSGKKSLRPRDIAVFPWERQQTDSAQKKLPEAELSREEIILRYEAAKKARGLK